MLCPNRGRMISEGFVLCPACGPGLSSGKTRTTVFVPCRKGQKWGFCDRDRKMVVQAAYDGVRPFAEGLANVDVGGK